MENLFKIVGAKCVFIVVVNLLFTGVPGLHRGFRRGWRCRSPPVRTSGFPWGTGVVYIPVREIIGLDVSEVVEIYDYEVEAFRLVHVEGLTMDEAAVKLGVSKATFWRILESCRHKVAKALSEGKPIKLVSGQLEENTGTTEKSI